MPKIDDRVRYRVLCNPQTAPEKDYTAEAIVTDVLPSGDLILMILPKRSDPCQVGPVCRVEEADIAAGRYRCWEPLDLAAEGKSE